MIAFSITWCLCYQVLCMQIWIVVTKNTHNLTTKQIHVDWWEKSPVQNPDPGIWPWDWWRLLLFGTRSQHVSVTTGKGTGWLLLWVTVAVQSCDPPPHPTAQTCTLKGWGHVTARPSTFPGLSGSSLWGWDANPHKPSITQRQHVSNSRSWRPEGKAPHCGDRGAPSNPIYFSLLWCRHGEFNKHGWQLGKKLWIGNIWPSWCISLLVHLQRERSVAPSKLHLFFDGAQRCF